MREKPASRLTVLVHSIAQSVSGKDPDDCANQGKNDGPEEGTAALERSLLWTMVEKLCGVNGGEIADVSLTRLWVGKRLVFGEDGRDIPTVQLAHNPHHTACAVLFVPCQLLGSVRIVG